MMMRSLLYFLVFNFGLFLAASAQYAPQAGLAGSSAISATSGRFSEWATGCVVHRGWQNIADTTIGLASAGSDSMAVGAADEVTVSLGDSGVADLTFLHPVVNGPGPDFAVFENGFRNATDSALAFLELAFVEVSSDGMLYVRFPATSLTETQLQLTNNSYIDATNLNNLAGKYIGSFGTPFDLEELAGTPGLDLSHVTHVRLVDVVGSVGGHASRDKDGRMINDPYPTPFASCGFDLDAVGVINEQFAAVRDPGNSLSFSVYPVPADDQVTMQLSRVPGNEVRAVITSIEGTVLWSSLVSQQSFSVPVVGFSPGLYFITLADAAGNKWTEKWVKR